MKPPSVISVSYVGDEVALPASYEQRQCAEYAKLGMMGVSVLYATGDHGAQGHSSQQCLDRTGKPARLPPCAAVLTPRALQASRPPRASASARTSRCRART